jgi:formylmethanofuran dehydrogenase subunit E
VTQRWSYAEGDVVDVDEYDDSVEVCEECDEEVLPEAARFDDGDPFCLECWADLFGEG